MAELPPFPVGFVVNHFITSDDVERSARFYRSGPDHGPEGGLDARRLVPRSMTSP
jgi:hypothetical protein